MGMTAMLKVPQSTAGETHQPRPSIFPHRIDMEGAAFRMWFDQRLQCAKSDLYQNPGPIQLSGPHADDRALTITSKFSYLHELDGLTQALAKVGVRCRPGCDPKAMRVAAQTLGLLNTILYELSGPPAAVEGNDARVSGQVEGCRRHENSGC